MIYVGQIIMQYTLNLHSVLCLVTQSRPTLWDPMDSSPPGSSIHGDSPGKNTKVNLPFTNYGVGEGNGTPLQYSCLENPMDGGAW